MNININKQVMKKYIPIVLIVLVMCCAFFIRMQSAYLPLTNGWAEQTIKNNIKNNIREELNKGYPNLPESYKQEQINKQYEEFIGGHKKEIKQQTKQLSNYFKSQFQDEDGRTYLLAIDPYTHYRRTKNLIEKGHTWDIEINGVAYNNHKVAPLGQEVNKKFSGATGHIWVNFIFYKIYNVFFGKGNVDRDLMHSSFFIPIILSMLCVIPAFFFGKRIGGNIIGVLLSLLIVINLMFVTRTMGGFTDTDAYSILFPLLILFSFGELVHADNIKKKFIWVGALGLIVGIFPFFWAAWWVFFDLVVATFILTFLHSLYKKQPNKHLLWMLLLFVVISLTVATLLTNKGVIVAPVTNALSKLKLKEVVHSTLWPNVYRTVAELNAVSFNRIINILGGPLIFMLSLIGISLSFRKKISLGVLFLLLFMGSIFIAIQGIRFILLIIPIFYIGLCIVADWSLKEGVDKISNSLRINMKTTKIILALIIFSLVMPVFVSSWNTSKQQSIPSMNDAWYNSLTYIKENSNENAIINSWWDFGHWFKAIGDRAVTFDGASQNTPMAYWIGKVLLTSNEVEAIGILRMLDCGSNNAFEVLNKVVGDTSKSVDILHSVIVLNVSEAREYLQNHNLSEDTIDEVLKNTHCQPPENYFITSDDMVQKAGVWAHFGSWDFEKAKIYDDANLIAGWPSYQSTIINCGKNNDILLCSNNIEIDLSNYNTTIKTQQGIIIPYSITYLNNDSVEEKVLNNEGDISISLLNNNKIMLMSKELGMSMFNRLYFYEGVGLDYFDLFYKEQGIMQTEVKIWKVDWEDEK